MATKPAFHTLALGPDACPACCEIERISPLTTNPYVFRLLAEQCTCGAASGAYLKGVEAHIARGERHATN